MGILSTLLEWHEQDPPDVVEQYRNEVIFMFQGNRNPFIDHPEWVKCVAAGLGILVPEWLAELPDGMADHWMRAVAEKLEEIRAGVC